MQIDFSQVVTAESLATEALVLARRDAETRLIALIDAATLAITGPVPLAEKLAWSSKEDVARAVLAAEATDAQAAILQGEAAVTGEKIDDLAGRILANANAYRAAVSAMAGIRRMAATAIASAPSPAAIDAALTTAAAQLTGLLQR